MEHEGQSLDSLLNDEPVTEPVEASEAEAALEPPEASEPAPDGPARGADGKFIPKRTTGVEETVPPTDKLPQEDYKAIREEREKRQALQARLEALEKQLNQQPEEAPAPPPSIWDDDKAALAHNRDEAVSTAVNQSVYLAKLQTSQIIASQAHDDFNEVWEPMNAFLTENPAVAQKVAADAHPWGAAYKAFKNHQTMQELAATDLDDLRAKIRAEVLAETQAQVPVTLPQTLPPTLTTERNVGSRTGPAWAGPKSLAEMLG